MSWAKTRFLLSLLPPQLVTGWLNRQSEFKFLLLTIGKLSCLKRGKYPLQQTKWLLSCCNVRHVVSLCMFAWGLGTKFISCDLLLTNYTIAFVARDLARLFQNFSPWIEVRLSNIEDFIMLSILRQFLSQKKGYFWYLLLWLQWKTS